MKKKIKMENYQKLFLVEHLSHKIRVSALLLKKINKIYTSNKKEKKIFN